MGSHPKTCAGALQGRKNKGGNEMGEDVDDSCPRGFARICEKG